MDQMDNAVAKVLPWVIVVVSIGAVVAGLYLICGLDNR
jgi:hypothetical protein